MDQQPSPLPADFQSRYGGAAPAVEPPVNAVLETMLGHRSVRAYLPDALAPGVLETLVAAAQSAPTSSNLQAWSVVAVQDPERKGRLADLSNSQRFIRQAPLFLCWVADLSRLTRLGEAHQRKLEGLDYSRASWSRWWMPRWPRRTACGGGEPRPRHRLCRRAAPPP